MDSVRTVIILSGGQQAVVWVPISYERLSELFRVAPSVTPSGHPESHER